MKKQIEVFDYANDILKAVKTGVLLTTKADDKVNTMTISWGTLGIEWGKTIFTVFVRENRFTKSQLDKNPEFTINIPVGEFNKKILGLAGTKSGHDMDKIKEIRRFFLLQVNDALFPIGGYSHSQGLETYIQQGIVHDEETAAEYIGKKLKLNLACTDLLGVRLAYEYALKEDVAALDMLEEILGASRIPMEQREASRKMGSRFTKTICKLPQENIPMEKQGIFEKYLETRKGKPVSHCCAYGVFCAALGIEEEETLYHYLYAQTSAMVTNCVKTIPLSQSAGQKLLCGCYGEFEEILSYISDCTEDDLCLSAPGFDIRGIQHEKLYSRLYMS